MKVTFEKKGGPFSAAPPTGEAFTVSDEDVKNKTVFDISDDAFKLLKSHGAKEYSEEVVSENPAKADKRKAEKK